MKSSTKLILAVVMLVIAVAVAVYYFGFSGGETAPEAPPVPAEKVPTRGMAPGTPR